MKLLFLVNGNARNILTKCNFSVPEFEVVKIDEKSLAQPKKILGLIRQDWEEVYFGCIAIEYQRFIPFMEIYILLSKARKGGIIDEDGKKVKFNSIKTVLVTIPLLIVELIASLFVVIYSYIYYFIWRKFKTRS